MKQKIGFIGLGIMGRHMSTNLINVGYELFVYDLNPKAVEELVNEGATACVTCKEVAEKSDVVISMVPDSPDVENVSLGENGIIDAARDGLIYLDMSTISPATSKKVADELTIKGVRCMDAPVSGGEVGAKNASLSIMVGGPEDLFDEVRPIFEVMGKTITLCGGNGTCDSITNFTHTARRVQYLPR